MTGPRTILIASLMRELGETGLQTYVRTFRDYLVSVGVSCEVVTPFSGYRVIAYPMFGMRRLLDRISSPFSVWWYRYWHYLALKMILRRRLAEAARAGTSILVFAQCPLSARAALEVRARADQRVVLAVHFNVSQADEWVGKGRIADGGRLYRSIRALEQRVIPAVDGIVYMSQFMRKAIEHAVPQAVSVPAECLPCFSRRAPAANPERTHDLISVGTLEPRKNQQYLVQVLARAKARGHVYSLTLVGNGPDRGRIEKLAEGLGVHSQLHFLGYRSDVLRLLGMHRIYVHASVMDNLPVALLEALSCGLPILAGEVGGVPEIFRDGVEGFFWPLDDADAGAARLIALMENEIVYRQLSAAAVERFSTHFDSERVGARVLRFLVDGNRASTGLQSDTDWSARRCKDA